MMDRESSSDSEPDNISIEDSGSDTTVSIDSGESESDDSCIDTRLARQWVELQTSGTITSAAPRFPFTSAASINFDVQPDGARICSEHSTSDSYERDLKVELLNIPAKKKLKLNAQPSLNLPVCYVQNSEINSARSKRVESLQKKVLSEGQPKFTTTKKMFKVFKSDSSELQLFPKLHWCHITVQENDRQRVAPAMELFSHHTAALIKYLVPESEEVHEFFQLINDFTDVMNSGIPKDPTHNKLKSAFGINHNEQVQILDRMEETIKELRDLVDISHESVNEIPEELNSLEMDIDDRIDTTELMKREEMEALRYVAGYIARKCNNKSAVSDANSSQQSPGWIEVVSHGGLVYPSSQWMATIEDIIYTGKGTVVDEEYKDLPVSSQVVMTLMKPLLGKDYCLTTDNFYTSLQLADILISKCTDTEESECQERRCRKL
ncbi:hypothetical protein ANN_01667 [Periplaneta americana]|uniref:PiggyBac transposable element-derived protein domain-containing protein n=1 Tax=Periplaneta americana TaxID=6978 RepID=A0ABQ8TV97_PERAM|nr:hypothetical protein ANN_01667 [Periplaneta americana]